MTVDSRVRVRKCLAVMLLTAIMILAFLPATSAGAAWHDLTPGGIGKKVVVAFKDEGNVFEQILAGIIEFPLRMSEWMLQAGGFLPISDLVFLEGSEREHQPWRTEAQATDVRSWFFAVAAVALPFMAFAIATTAFKLLYAATNPAARAEAQGSILRWFGAAIMIAMAPILVYTMLWLSQIMVDGIKAGFSLAVADGDRSVGWWGIDFADLNITTGSALGTAFVKVAFFLMFIYLNVLYLVRMIAISVMYIFTPFVAVMWSINKNVNAAGIWFGELASNAFMPVVHAIVLCTILILSDVSKLGEDGSGSWLQILILMYTLIPLSEVLRNSMQSLLTRMSGLAEESVASRATMGLLGLGGLVGMARVGAAALHRPTAPPSGRPPTSGMPQPHKVKSKLPPHYKGGQSSDKPGVSTAGGIWSRGRGTSQAVGRWTEAGARMMFAPVAGAIPGGRQVADTMGHLIGKGAEYTSRGVHAGAEVARRMQSGETLGSVARDAIPGGAKVADAMGRVGGKGAEIAQRVRGEERGAVGAAVGGKPRPDAAPRRAPKTPPTTRTASGGAAQLAAKPDPARGGKQVRGGKKIGTGTRKTTSSVGAEGRPVTGPAANSARRLYRPSPGSRLDSFRRHR